MRINLYAGPGAGKSTTAAWLFASLKRRGYSIELVSEYIKSWAVAKRNVAPFDQLYLMGKQLHYEYRFLSNSIKNIVTDSPVLLSAIYARSYFPELNIADSMESIVAEYEKSHPSLNIFLNRGDKEYHTEGRWQSKEEAQSIDKTVRLVLDRNEIKYHEFSFFDHELILDHVISHIPLP